MFEQAVLPSGPGGRRCWSVIVGFAGEFLLLACVLVAPLIWPQLLPRAQTLAWIMAPAPPPPTKSRAAARTPVPKPYPTMGGKVYVPVSIPPQALMIDDPPPDNQTAGVEGGVKGFDAGIAALGLFRPMGALPRAAEPAVTAPPVKAALSPTRQIRVVSALQMARLLRRVEPVYPPLARQTRISGTVELTGVIATDGRIRELRVVSGHPFLAAAALEAVRQWVYEPTMLNSEPVEVIAPITVNFRLN
jgi:protein TonB